MSYLHVPSVRLPAALADLHRTLVVGAPLEIQVLAGDYEGTELAADRLGGRFFAAWTPERLTGRARRGRLRRRRDRCRR